MTMAAKGHSIVLLGRISGRDRAVAQALADFFGQTEEWGLQIVGATPITLFFDLSAEQAQSIYSELARIEEKAGCRFRTQLGLDENFPKVNWGKKLATVLPRFKMK